jgi:hypothetical protein
VKIFVDRERLWSMDTQFRSFDRSLAISERNVGGDAPNFIHITRIKVLTPCMPSNPLTTCALLDPTHSSHSIYPSPPSPRMNTLTKVTNPNRSYSIPVLPMIILLHLSNILLPNRTNTHLRHTISFGLLSDSLTLDLRAAHGVAPSYTPCSLTRKRLQNGTIKLVVQTNILFTETP